MNLRAAWEAEAPNWIRWAREPGHDSYWRFHREAFLESLPAPGRLTLDVGCGEGRVTRDLRDLGHRVVGVDPMSLRVQERSSRDQDAEIIEALRVRAQPWTAEDGSLAVPARTWVAAATA